MYALASVNWYKIKTSDVHHVQPYPYPILATSMFPRAYFPWSNVQRK